MKSRVVVAKKGWLTFLLGFARSTKIEDEKAIFLIETKDGILLKPLNSFWDWIGNWPR
jgi:hypothetical protein